MLVELTIATTGGRTAIAVDSIAEVVDLAAYPSRDLERFGRCRVTVKAKRRVHHEVRESYDTVMERIREAMAARPGRCPAEDGAQQTIGTKPKDQVACFPTRVLATTLAAEGPDATQGPPW